MITIRKFENIGQMPEFNAYAWNVKLELLKSGTCQIRTDKEITMERAREIFESLLEEHGEDVFNMVFHTADIEEKEGA